MKKIFLFLSLYFSFILSISADSINQIKMDIFLDENGNAKIKEIWNVTINNGTEGYKPYYNLGRSEIINFSVSDDEGNKYTNVGTWNSNLSLNDKAYKSGINYLSDGLELCWGISKYGNRIYTLEYEITNFVAETSDYQMIYWTLVSDKIEPREVIITIKSDTHFNQDMPVWGYGNYGGTAYVYNGIIEMNSDGKLDYDEYMTILVQIPMGTFNTSNILNEDFNYYYEMAEEGTVHFEKDDLDNDSGYYQQKPSIFNIIAEFIPFIIFISSISAVTIFTKKNSASFKKVISKGKFPKDLNYFRDIPCNKNIYYAYFLASSYNLNKKDTDFLGTLILSWIKNGVVTIETTSKKGLFKTKEEAKLILHEDKMEVSYSEYEKEMFDHMYKASRDGILESKEFEKYCQRKYTQIIEWFNKVKKYEKTVCTKNGLLLKSNYRYSETEAIYDEAKKLAGLKKFLNEFSSIDEKKVLEVHLWDYYLMYAQIFGIADKVAEEFKKMYPDVITDLNYNNIIFIHGFSTRAMSSALSARQKAASYSAGGGGFSSGGGGGGSFGGGGGGGGFR